VPFRGDTEWEVLRQHEIAAPRYPDWLPTRERAILERCLHKDPACRFQSVSDLLSAFGAPLSVGAAVAEAVHGGVTGAVAPTTVAPPIQPPPPSPLPWVAARMRPRLGRAFLLAALALLLLSLPTCWLVRGGPSPQARFGGAPAEAPR
jgi:hypothetical protein